MIDVDPKQAEKDLLDESNNFQEIGNTGRNRQDFRFGQLFLNNKYSSLCWPELFYCEDTFTAILIIEEWIKNGCPVYTEVFGADITPSQPYRSMIVG